MATLTTGVVNAGFPVSGAPAVIKRGSVPYFSVVKKTTQLFNDTSFAGTPQTSFTTQSRTSITYALPVTFETEVGVTKYFAVVKDQTFAAETTEVLQVDVRTNPYYLTNILKVNSTINETEVGTTGFYHIIVPHTFSTTSIAPIVNPNTNLTANSINSMTISVPNVDVVSVMDPASFDLTLSTRQIGTQDTLSEPEIFALNVKDTYTNQNSPVQIVLNNVSSKIVEQNNNLGRIDSSEIQPKGSEAGNIGFAQAFGNTTIVGKWF